MLAANVGPAADVQATLLKLTATTIADAARNSVADLRRLIICSGGSHNSTPLACLEELLQTVTIETSAAQSIAPEWVEVAGFAWLARARLIGAPGNLPSVTGARERAQLGGVYSEHQENA